MVMGSGRDYCLIGNPAENLQGGGKERADGRDACRLFPKPMHRWCGARGYQPPSRRSLRMPRRLPFPLERDLKPPPPPPP